MPSNFVSRRLWDQTHFDSKVKDACSTRERCFLSPQGRRPVLQDSLGSWSPLQWTEWPSDPAGLPGQLGGRGILCFPVPSARSRLLPRPCLNRICQIFKSSEIPSCKQKIRNRPTFCGNKSLLRRFIVLSVFLCDCLQLFLILIFLGGSAGNKPTADHQWLSDQTHSKNN